jgi:hypothetical protein
LPRLLDGAEEFLLIGIEFPQTAHQLGQIEDAVEGRLEVVAHDAFHVLADFLQFLALGNVFLDGHGMGDGSGLVPDGRDGGILPIELAVFLTVAKFPVPDPARDQGLPHLPIKGAVVDPAFEHARILSPGLFGSVTGQGGEMRVHVLDIARGVGNDNGGRRGFHRRPQQTQ